VWRAYGVFQLVVVVSALCAGIAGALPLELVGRLAGALILPGMKLKLAIAAGLLRRDILGRPIGRGEAALDALFGALIVGGLWLWPPLLVAAPLVLLWRAHRLTLAIMRKRRALVDRGTTGRQSE
jgi:hypothetical protein